MNIFSVGRAEVGHLSEIMTTDSNTNTCAQPINWQPDTKSNPNPNRTTKQHAIVRIRLSIITRPTHPEKFIRDDVVASILQLAVVTVTLPLKVWCLVRVGSKEIRAYVQRWGGGCGLAAGSRERGCGVGAASLRIVSSARVGQQLFADNGHGRSLNITQPIERRAAESTCPSIDRNYRSISHTQVRKNMDYRVAQKVSHYQMIKKSY